MFYGGMINAMGGGLGNAGAIGGASVADLFKRRMQEGSAQDAVDMMRKAAEANQPSMGATPGAFLGSQMGNVAGISFDINESAKNRKMRAIRKLSETGVGGEKDAALEKLKNAGPQLPLAMGNSMFQMGNPMLQMGNVAGMYGTQV